MTGLTGSAAPAAEPAFGHVRLTHLGGPTVLIEVDGWRLLTDPTFDAPGMHYSFEWGAFSRKSDGPAIAPADLGRIDAVLLSHDQHGDNLDRMGRSVLPSAGVVVTTTAGARRLGGSATGLAPWMATTLSAPDRSDLQVTATPCRHGPPFSRPITGDAIGFALRSSPTGSSAIWISGDTVLYDGVRSMAGRIDVDIAVIHLGAVQFPVTGPFRYTMTARDAVELCALIRPRVMIPVHYEGWRHFHEGKASIEREFAEAPADIARSIMWLSIGSPTDIRPVPNG